MKDSGGGSIVNIGSVAGITGNFSTAYSASKWALEGLSRFAAYVYADRRSRCNVIQPGSIETDMTAQINSLTGHRLGCETTRLAAFEQLIALAVAAAEPGGPGRPGGSAVQARMNSRGHEVPLGNVGTEPARAPDTPEKVR